MPAEALRQMRRLLALAKEDGGLKPQFQGMDTEEILKELLAISLEEDTPIGGNRGTGV